MSDELNDDVSELLRSVMHDLADAAPPEPPVEDLFGPFIYTKGVYEMRSKRWIWAAAAAAVIVVIVSGVAVLSADDDPSTNVAAEPDPQSAADADAGCGLNESASVIATVDASGESVTIDVTSDPACSGVEVTVSATPATQGIPIVKNLTLDETGAASLTDQLLGSRQAEQGWSVELIVSDTGGVAVTGDFAVTEFCDLEGTADLQVTYLPETNDVSIVLTLEPLCAGTMFTFDREGLFASSPRGGWNTYTVDEAGRIEVTERLVASGPIISIEAIPAPTGGGYLAGPVAIETIDISG